jgi:uncharacterized membrane protein
MKQKRWLVESVEVTGFIDGEYALSIAVTDGATEKELALTGTTDGTSIALSACAGVSAEHMVAIGRRINNSSAVDKMLVDAIDDYVGIADPS